MSGWERGKLIKDTHKTQTKQNKTHIDTDRALGEGRAGTKHKQTHTKTDRVLVWGRGVNGVLTTI